MVLPQEIGDAAQYAFDDDEAARVLAWLDEGGDVNDVDKDGYTLIHCCAIGDQDCSEIHDAHVSLARKLIALGADVNIPTRCPGVDKNTPLLNASRADSAGPGEAALDMIKLLLDAKANPNARTPSGENSLKVAIAEIYYDRDTSLAVIRMLLRAGASLDCIKNASGEIITAEDILSSCYDEDYDYDEAVIEIKALVAGVRKHGTYKKYMREPHREVLACRGLVMRGYFASKETRRPRGPHKWKAAVTFLAKQGDNGIVWNILSYWRATH